MQSIGIIAKTSTKQNSKVIPVILDYFKKKDIKVCFGKHIPELFPESKVGNPYRSNIDMLIVLGGDGTILRSARHLQNFDTLIFGINLGTLGFLSEMHPDIKKITAVLDKIFAGEYDVDERMMLEASVIRKGKEVAKFHVLNEFSISVDGIARLITLHTTVDNRKLASYHADALIIATPTGSTGYSLSAGGPIVYPTLPAIIVTPVNSHSFTQKPIIIPDDKKLTIEVESKHEKGVITMDGQKNFKLESSDVIKIRKHKKTFKFVRLPGESYFRTLRKKLNWGKRLEK